MKHLGYSIKDLEVLSGIKTHTIRIWEKRYNLLQPKRTETNIRYYDEDDLRRMLNVALLVRNGYKISKVASWDENSIVRVVLEVSEEKISESDYIERLVLFMVNFDNDNFINLIDEIIVRKGLEEATAKIFMEFFVRVGLYWQVGTVFPAQEHYVSNIFRQKISAETEKLPKTKKKNEVILFFLPENEMHELSLLFYNYLAGKVGYQTIYLGQSVPWNDLKRVREQLKPDIVFTAFIRAWAPDELLYYLGALNELFDYQRIFITGRQLQLHQPVTPRNIKQIKDYREFKKYLI